MRLLIAALALSLTVAVVAAVFAIWPVVADAPWEESGSVDAKDCSTLRERRKAAEEFDIYIWDVTCADVGRVRQRYDMRCEAALRLRESAVGSTSTNRSILSRAQSEITRYC